MYAAVEIPLAPTSGRVLCMLMHATKRPRSTPFILARNLTTRADLLRVSVASLPPPSYSVCGDIKTSSSIGFSLGTAN